MNLKRIILAAAIGLQLATGAGAQNYSLLPSIGDRVIYVDTVADMLALPPGKSLNGQVVVTKRYSTNHTPGDGSGNAYRSDTGEGGTPDGGFILDDTGTHWHAVDKSVANVMQFGAVGDGDGAGGGTDDSAAIQAAIDAMDARGGGMVQVPENTYYIGSTLIPRGNVTIAGDGMRASVLDATGIFAANNYAIYAQYAPRSLNFAMRDLSVVSDLTYFDNDGSDKSLVTLTAAVGASIERCYFSGGEYGVVLYAGATDCSVYGCVFSDCWYGGVFARGTSGSRCSRIAIRDCVAYTSAAPELFSWDDSTDTFTISAGTTGILDDTPVRVRGTIPTNLSKTTAYYYAVNCTSTTIQLAASIGGAAIDLGDTNGSAVCRVGYVWAGGFRTDYCDDCTITGCTAYKCNQGFRVEHSDACVIASCVGYENESVGLELYNVSSDNIVQGCEFRDNNTSNNDGTDTTANATNPNRKLAGISIESQCDRNLIAANKCFQTAGGNGFQKYGIAVNIRNFSSTATQSEGTRLVGNVCEGNDVAEVSDRGYLSQHDGEGYAEIVTAASPALSPGRPTEIDSSSNAVNATLGSGTFVGQTKTIVMTDASNSSTVSVTNHVTSDPEVFTFDAVDEYLVLMWSGTEWVTIAGDATT